jgi:hypothetical protein
MKVPRKPEKGRRQKCIVSEREGVKLEINCSVSFLRQGLGTLLVRGDWGGGV